MEYIPVPDRLWKVDPFWWHHPTHTYIVSVPPQCVDQIADILPNAYFRSAGLLAGLCEKERQNYRYSPWTGAWLQTTYADSIIFICVFTLWDAGEMSEWTRV